MFKLFLFSFLPPCFLFLMGSGGFFLIWKSRDEEDEYKKLLIGLGLILFTIAGVAIFYSVNK